MSPTLQSRAASAVEGQTWTFINDNRFVGEMTKVACTVANGEVLEGWAAITAYRSSMTKGGVAGMCVVGPVFSTAKRGKILDLQPIFSRLENQIPCYAK